jgi:hypothetical protein
MSSWDANLLSLIIEHENNVDNQETAVELKKQNNGGEQKKKNRERTSNYGVPLHRTSRLEAYPLSAEGGEDLSS